MINSKNKSPCAYIKSNHNKHKTQHNTKHSSPMHTPPAAEQKQNIYDSLLNALQQQDCQYILKLLEKQEKKTNKKQTQMHNKSHHKDMLEDTTNYQQHHNIASTDNKTNRSIKKSVVSSPRYSAKQIKLENNKHQEQQKLRTFLSSQCLSYDPKIGANKNFIQNINSYLSEIKESHSGRKSRSKVQEQREFRKTIEMGERRAIQNYQGQVSAKKYHSVLSQLQKVLRINDLLQQRIGVQQQDMEQMKQIIKSMFYQIKHLKQQLKEQKHQKAKYSQVLHYFSAQISKLKHESKQKRQRSYKKRNSYIPHSSMFQSELELTKTKHKKLILNKHFDLSYLHKENDSTPLKKRGKLHKYKISDGCFDFLDEESQSTASIYKERQ